MPEWCDLNVDETIIIVKADPENPLFPPLLMDAAIDT